MKTQKGNVVVVVLIVLVVVITVGVFVWMFTKKMQTPTVPVVTQTPTQPVPIDETVGWKTYKNDKLGFSFMYPENWKDQGREVEVSDYFFNEEGVSVLQVEIDDKFNGIDLTKYIEKNIKERDCQSVDDATKGDHIIERMGKAILYVEYCSATSEDYIYGFINSQGKLIKLDYHDDFDESFTEGQKIKKFKKIINSLNIFTASSVSTGVLYENKELGFQLTLPQSFSGYKVNIEESQFGEDGTYVYFWVPTSDKGWGSNKKMPGYASVFSIRIMPLSRWATLEKECQKESTPICPYAFLMKNDQYAFDFWSAQDGPVGFDKLITAEYVKQNITSL